MQRAVAAGVMVLLTSGAALAQDEGCKPLPTFMPARDSAADLRCFSHRSTTRIGGDHDATSPLSLVLGFVGTAGLGTFIGFGIGGQAQLSNGVAPHAALDSIRTDYAIANVGLAVGVTALVTSIILILSHR